MIVLGFTATLKPCFGDCSMSIQSETISILVRSAVLCVQCNKQSNQFKSPAIPTGLLIYDCLWRTWAFSLDLALIVIDIVWPITRTREKTYSINECFFLAQRFVQFHLFKVESPNNHRTCVTRCESAVCPNIGSGRSSSQHWDIVLRSGHDIKCSIECDSEFASWFALGHFKCLLFHCLCPNGGLLEHKHLQQHLSTCLCRQVVVLEWSSKISVNGSF